MRYTVILSPDNGGATSALFEVDEDGRLPAGFTIPIPNRSSFWEEADVRLDRDSLILDGAIVAAHGYAVFVPTGRFQVFTFEEVVAGTYEVMPFPVLPPPPGPASDPPAIPPPPSIAWPD